MQKDEQRLTVKDYVGIIKVHDTYTIIYTCTAVEHTLCLNTHVYVHSVSVRCMVEYIYLLPIQDALIMKKNVCILRQ